MSSKQSGSRSDRRLSGLIRVQSVHKSYEQMTQVDNELMDNYTVHEEHSDGVRLMI